MSERWVINASPVILLAKVGLIAHVPSLVDEFAIPQPVISEILGGGRSDSATVWLDQSGKPFIRPAVEELNELSGAGIEPGERAVISWAAAHPGFVAVLDDLEARVIAQRLGVKVIGTVGVVLRLKKAGLIPEAKPHLEQIRAVGGYISNDLFRAALGQVGEQV